MSGQSCGSSGKSILLALELVIWGAMVGKIAQLVLIEAAEWELSLS
ncbi:MAG: hypothetical protein R2795_05990 [Saprospiraceae bacterium]